MCVKTVFLQQEVFRAKKKRDRKSRHGVGDTGLDDERLEAELSTIPRPQFTDVLPIVLARFAVRVVTGIPSSVRLIVESYHEWKTAEMPSDEPGSTVKNVLSLLYK